MPAANIMLPFANPAALYAFWPAAGTWLPANTACGSCCCYGAGERGPSAGKEWFWLRNNPKLDPSHLLPDFSHLPTANPTSTTGPLFDGTWASAVAGGAGRPWQVPGGMWWEEGWRLGAVCLHSWPAHRDRLRAMAVDPWERLLVTAGGWVRPG
jgi:hypothetical protein